MDMATSDSDGEYEYEYGPETETFYLNLDLTAHHGAVRPPRRRKDPAVSFDTPQLSRHNGGIDRPSEAFGPIQSTERGGYSNNERIQVLGLHTCNPIVSYQNQMFSCSWADQIGTELVFSSPNTAPDPANQPEPLHRGPSFELVAANSVKILGRKAHLTSSSGKRVAPTTEAGTPATNALFDTTSQEPAQMGVPRRPAAPSYQAQFLNQLQDLKASRGESDTVRMVMGGRRGGNGADSFDRQGWERTEASLAKLRLLQEQAASGDVEAQMKLEIMAQEIHPGFDSDSEYDWDSDDLP
ncbi:unnamed protein product [Penicillium salamii]|uniref:Transcription factor TFIIIC triple barrel domain-containing protein n=1 Tax=Penicillium salamii TaxID=1612424 RepID=A0A9W4IKE3_9EURO|nr:unnamed protein product [Penicillium salamii]CAG8099792.1 unnamed protein product [Penicillium salamii]CAG8155142.1 unnamed protein product [Penicillium salamii]CAG8161455.1 unnamed protein product [Penicillium salamii]CAG8218436.1 unnamed protein product [Penicillium salamii]